MEKDARPINLFDEVHNEVPWAVHSLGTAYGCNDGGTHENKKCFFLINLLKGDLIGPIQVLPTCIYGLECLPCAAWL